MLFKNILANPCGGLMKTKALFRRSRRFVGDEWSGCGDRRSDDRSFLHSEEEDNNNIDDVLRLM